MNFQFHTPTKLVFGAATRSRLGEIASGCDKKPRSITGGGTLSEATRE